MINHDFAKNILNTFGVVYIVGGALRDAVFKRKFKDLDLVVPPQNNFIQKVKRLARILNASCFEMDKENNVWRLTSYEKDLFQIDIMPFCGGSIETDIKRRDFTINSLALLLEEDTKLFLDEDAKFFTLKPKNKKIIDLCGGLKDAKAKKLITVGDSSFKNDPVRLLRAFRIASDLNLELSRKTLSQIKKDSHLLKNSAPERIREELLKLLRSDKSAYWIKCLYDCGLLTQIAPELAEQTKCATDYYGKGGVFKHTLCVIQRMDELFKNIKDYFPNYDMIPTNACLNKPYIYKFAALMHDVAKPAKAANINGRLRFFGHEECGAIMTKDIMENLRFSNEDIKMVTAIIGSHLRPGNLAANETITDKAMFKFFRTMGEYTLPLLILSWADQSSYITPAYLKKIKNKLSEPPIKVDLTKLPYNSPKKTLRFMQTLYKLANVYITKNPNKHGKLLVNGNDVIKKLKIKPGPKVGEILEQLRLMQFENKIKTREQALDAIRAVYKDIKK